MRALVDKQGNHVGGETVSIDRISKSDTYSC